MLWERVKGSLKAKVLNLAVENKKVLILPGLKKKKEKKRRRKKLYAYN